MYAAAMRIEVHIPDSGSLKAKRRVLRPFVEGIRRLGSYSVAEVGLHDTWQRAVVGVAVVASDPAELERLMVRVRSYVDDHVELSVLDVRTSYLEEPDG